MKESPFLKTVKRAIKKHPEIFEYLKQYEWVKPGQKVTFAPFPKKSSDD